MFEKFTDEARAVVVGAIGQAERAGAASVDDGHVLLALLALLDESSNDEQGAAPGAGASTGESAGKGVVRPVVGRAAFALRALSAADRRTSIERALAEARRRGGLSRADTQALADLGVDVDEIVSRVEEAHGVGALAGAGTLAGGGVGAGAGAGAGRRGWRQRLGRVPFGRDAKEVLVKSLRLATARHDRSIGGQHLLLSLCVRPGVVSEILADHGVTYANLERVLYGEAA
ncbi:Clp protease N-terminal domain-containing protein [Streptomyces sp. NPDC005863]|uniref:Clp protease N-terminal domain-containing protein n=1 Tax=unclassified Streptomyces TaxID=2593676 RepID=UPI0033F98A55